ncbi:MAG: ABC transporter ATP-binding protein [Oligoflexales bacterium]
MKARALFAQYIIRNWQVYIWGGFFVFITNSSEILIPKFIQWSLDFLSFPDKSTLVPSFFVSSDKVQTLGNILLGMVAALFVAYIGRIGWRQTLARASHNAGYELKSKFWDALRYQSISIFKNYSLGDLMNRAIGDWKNARFIHGFTLVLTFDVIFFTSLAVISMLQMNVELTILCLLTAPFLPRPITRLTKKEGRLHEEAQNKLSSLSEIIAQAINTIKLQRGTGSEAIWQTKLKNEATAYANQRFEVLRTEWQIFPLGALPTLFAYVVLLTYGIKKVIAGDVTVGEFVAMQSYVLLLQNPLFELGQVVSEWQTGLVSYGRLAEIFNLKGRPDPSALKELSETDATAKTLDIQNFSFTYPDAKGPALDNVSLSIERGEFIGITGPIGSGKSTLLKAISGLLEDYKGSIGILGTDIGQMNRELLSRLVLLVSQKPFIFSGSVRYNLSLGEDYSDDDLWNALRIAQVDKDIAEFDGQLDSWIGEWGVNLSGGQKQRLNIARAILRKPRILLLDDCLSAVDAITEEFMLDLIREHFDGHSVVWVAHRKSTLKMCKKVYEMNDGRLRLGDDERNHQ